MLCGAALCLLQKMAATALWVAAKLEEVKEVREHPRKLIEMVMVAVDRCITRRETPEGRKLAVLDSHSKVRGSRHGAHHTAQHWAWVAGRVCHQHHQERNTQGPCCRADLVLSRGCPAGG